MDIKRIKKIFILIILGLFFAGPAINAQDVRIEQEDKIFVPRDRADEVWQYLYGKYITDHDSVKELDPLFTTYQNDEQFTDTYFDTPDLKLLDMQSSVRYRRRINLTDPDDPKSGRELMQIKMNDISDNPLERGEIKFDIEHSVRMESREDRHVMLGIIKADQRGAFVRELSRLGLDPYAMRPVLTINDFRRRIYFNRAGIPFMSITFDNASSKTWWVKAEFVEIEPELSEAEFTGADEETKKYMEETMRKVTGDLKQRFPFLRTNLDPKYNKAFSRIEQRLPFLKFLVKNNLHNSQGLALAGFAAVLLVAFIVWAALKLFKRTGKLNEDL